VAQHGRRVGEPVFFRHDQKVPGAKEAVYSRKSGCKK
jgi:hypothetical protein